MDIKIDSEAVNRAVSDAIIKSALGEELEKSITKHIQDSIHGYNSPVRKMVEQEIYKAIHSVLETNFKGAIVQQVAELLSAEHVTKIVHASVAQAMKLLKDY